MYLVASVRPSVRPSVNALKPVCLCVCNQSAYADNRADAVDRLLILHGLIHYFYLVGFLYTISSMFYDTMVDLPCIQ